VPLEIDPQRRHVVGVAIRPGHVEVGKLNLLGQTIGEMRSSAVRDAASLIETMTEMLRAEVSDQTFAVGLTTPGFVDAAKHTILFSSALVGSGAVSLQPAYDVARGIPIVLENDMHALAARWLLAHQAQQQEDVLLVYFEDGQLGSALLIDGRPNRGCVTGANELGHTRMPVETEVCYCGHPGCLERICSTTFLRRQGGNSTLAERAAEFDDADEGIRKLIELLAMGIANAANFTRANRLVLVSELTRQSRFTESLIAAVRGHLLTELKERVRIEHWDQAAARTAETAGWLALASLYYEGWHQPAVRAAS
jgi:predicted NBD/HSP70 family sugar kinase